MRSASIEKPEIEPAELASSEMDMDDAFAWLESLAAKQGADEETLITAPDERSETPPEWVQQQQETAELTQPEQQVDALTSEEPVSLVEEPISAVNDQASQTLENELPDWLKTLEDEQFGQEVESLEKSFIDQFGSNAAPAEEQTETHGFVENTEINPETWLSGGEEPAVEPNKAADETRGRKAAGTAGWRCRPLRAWRPRPRRRRNSPLRRGRSAAAGCRATVAQMPGAVWRSRGIARGGPVWRRRRRGTRRAAFSGS